MASLLHTGVRLASSVSIPYLLVRCFSSLNVQKVSSHVYNVELNRPDKLNAMDKTLWFEIGDAFKELDGNTECRAIILSGAGKIFTSGIDLSFLAEVGKIIEDKEKDVARKANLLSKFILSLQNSFTNIEKCQKPVIVAIHGACIGGGVDLITATDIRLCTSDAWFQVKEVDLGLAADVGTLQRLPKVIGSQSLVRELCFTARKFSSEESKCCGLVSAVYPDKQSMMKAATDMAETIAKKSPVAVQGTKFNLNYARDHSVNEALSYMATFNSAMLQTEDIVSSTMAVLSKSNEAPTFSDF